MEGVTIAVGNTTTPNTLTLLSTQFLPGQVAVALANGFNPTVFAAESLGSALSTNTAFNTNFVGLNVSQFSQAVATATGVNANAIQQFVNNWTAFFTANPSALQGRTVTQASYGAAFGDAVGVALLNPTSANLQTQVSTNPAFPFSPNTIQGLVANALITIAEGTYKVGTPLASQVPHDLLQGEAGVAPGTFNLTVKADVINTNFANAVFVANPDVTQLGLNVNTLNNGDNLKTADGKGTLNYTAAGVAFGANPPLATGITMDGISTANITGVTPGVLVGFQGNVTGLLVENNLNSQGGVVIGGPGQGLHTLLTNINITNFAGGNGVVMNDVRIDNTKADLTKTIAIKLTGGQLGTTAAGAANEIRISDDLGGGTAANPNKTYGTWELTVDNNANLQLDQSDVAAGVGGATNLVLKGKGDVAVGQDAPGDWQLLQKIDASAATGKVVITGASSPGTGGVLGNAFASVANPSWLFGSNAGLLNNPTGWSLTSVLLGSGVTFLDVSAATEAQVKALTTTPLAAGPVAGSEIIVKSAVANTLTTDTFTNIKGFTVLGIGGANAADAAQGTINMKNLPPAINTIVYQSPTLAGSTLSIINPTAPLTVNVNDNGNATGSLLVGVAPPPNGSGPTGIFDAFNLTIGNTLQNAAGTLGAGLGAGGIGLNVRGYELVSITSAGGTAAAPNTLGYSQFTETVGGPEQITITGDHNINVGTFFMGAIADVGGAGGLSNNNLRIIIDDTGITRFIGAQPNQASPLAFASPGDAGIGSVHGYSTNAVFIDASKSGGLIMNEGDANAPNANSVNTIIGSTTAGNVLGGSIGKDVFTASNNAPNTIYTGGGADTVNLLAGHTASNHIGIYVGVNNENVTGPIQPGQAVLGQASSITTATGDVPRIGMWGLKVGDTPTGHTGGGVYNGLADGTGTSGTMAVVNGFVPSTPAITTDILRSGRMGHWGYPPWADRW